jgi:hypothetical protein
MTNDIGSKEPAREPVELAADLVRAVDAAVAHRRKVLEEGPSWVQLIPEWVREAA